MSKKTYIAVASILRETPMGADVRELLVERFEHLFQQDNSRFSPALFHAACGGDANGHPGPVLAWPQVAAGLGRKAGVTCR